MFSILKKLLLISLFAFSANYANAENANDGYMAFVDKVLAEHAGQTGLYVLEKGSEALIARAWLANHAQHSIEVQYFIWSSDNIGILASEALLSAAERGVKVRVIVDDLLIDAPDKTLLALAKHPNVDIRIYNPLHSVGTPPHKRLINVLTNFRGVNQRMHDKTFIVDGKIAITGGRNMAAEYFDYNNKYNFRDRDILLLGDAVKDMQQSFDTFWTYKLSASVESLYDGIGLMQKNVSVKDDEVKSIYLAMHAYAVDDSNFSPEVRAAIDAIPEAFPRIVENLIWTKAIFISDQPGKNKNKLRLGGSGQSTLALANLVASAQNELVIQSPYLVMSSKAIKLFEDAIARGVRVRINTNSLASTDNIQAFSGYRNQRNRLIKMGVEVYEYKPTPEIQTEMMVNNFPAREQLPVFAIHAKTMVVDAKTVYIGTFNFDPRSENLNTEVGLIVHEQNLAKKVQASIERDMEAANSWNAAVDNPDQYVSILKRTKVRFWQLLPIKPLL